MMALVERPDPKKKLLIAAIIDALLVGAGVVVFLITNSAIWFILALVAGAVISAPLLLSAAREMKEQADASR
ncbi:MAG: hypothetical protein AAFR82_08870 [Pseudomonadota bacterium]